MPTTSSDETDGAGVRARITFYRCAMVLAWAAASPPFASAQSLPPAPPVPLLGYCAPPLVPSCVDGLRNHPGDLPFCGPEMDRYVASVFAYRACLERETERAVRESNVAIAKLRCAQKRGPC